MLRRRIEVGAQFLTTGPVMDPAAVSVVAERLALQPDDPPVYLEVAPPFSARWARRMQGVGAIPISDALRERLGGLSDPEARAEGWRAAKQIASAARDAGFAGIVLMGLRFDTVVGEAYDVWHADSPTPPDVPEGHEHHHDHDHGHQHDHAH
jgi:5,10-methylenetetrahydrofolate reductase